MCLGFVLVLDRRIDFLGGSVVLFFFLPWTLFVRLGGVSFFFLGASWFLWFEGLGRFLDVAGSCFVLFCSLQVEKFGLANIMGGGQKNMFCTLGACAVVFSTGDMLHSGWGIGGGGGN